MIGINADYVDQALIFVVFAVSLNLLMGVAGQASMAQAGFGAVGGYVAAALSVHHGITFVPAALIGIVAGVIVGGVVSLPALRLSGEYLILLTLAVGTVIISLIETIPSLGGVQGLLGVGQVKVLGWTATSTKSFLPFLGGIALVTLAVCLRISSSGYGRVLRAIREDEVAARGIGKNTFRFKGQTFAITSGMAALAGVLIVYYNQVAAPGFFVVDESIVIITMLVLGGTGNLLGSAVGAAVVIWLDPVLRFVIHVDPATSAVLRLVIYGLVLVVVMIFRPEGLIPERGAFPWAVVWRRFVRQDVVDEAVPAAIHGSGTGAARMLGPSAVGQVSWETLGPAGVSPTAGWRPSGSGKDISEGGKEEAGGRMGASGMGAKGPLMPGVDVGGDAAVVVVRGLRKSFGGITAVDGVDIELPARTVTALIGPNGAGKSTLFGLLTGSVRSDAGVMLLNGASVKGLSPDRIARMGMVRSFQDVRLFQRLTVLENVAVAVPHQPGEHLLSLFVHPIRVRRGERLARDEALQYLGFVGMAHAASAVAGSLSYAEQKLVAIARAIATRAEVLLLDEPTSGVDPAWVDRIAETIRDLPKLQKTVCIVEHNLSFLEKIGAPCYFLEMGTVTQHGQLRDLMGEERLRKAYFGV